MQCRYKATAENVHGRATCSAYIGLEGLSPMLSPAASSTTSLHRLVTASGAAGQPARWSRPSGRPPSSPSPSVVSSATPQRFGSSAAPGLMMTTSSIYPLRTGVSPTPPRTLVSKPTSAVPTEGDFASRFPADSGGLLTPTSLSPFHKRGWRETSAPPPSFHVRSMASSTRILKIASRRRTPPVELTFRLPKSREQTPIRKSEVSYASQYCHRPEMADHWVELVGYTSRHEILQVSTLVDSHIPPRGMVKHSSSVQHIHQIHVTPMRPQYEARLDRRVSSHPRLSPGYASDEETHEHPIQVVPMVRRYHSRLDISMAARPTLEPAFATEADIEQPLHVVPMRKEYRTEIAQRLAGRPYLEPGYSSSEEYENPMEVVPMVEKTDFRTQIKKRVPSRPLLREAYESTYEFMRSIELRRQSFETTLKASVPSRPEVLFGFESRMDRELSMDICPVVPEERRFTSELKQEFKLQYRPVEVVLEMPTPPQFIEQLRSITAEEGARVVLDGVVQGRPEPRISWYRAGREIKDAPDFRLDYSGGRVTLTLSEVSHIHFG
ncbi:unnamed protein product [Protopolystoma xenopodis]|uniref:Ig-like domain-containing protein n=1 Tax=Protopolystoma xenopodis TaxID=117903 RepID=A0A3S5CSE7_9PLAT|nr:unnamed protein product [Protopolystoma xenopodis]